MNRTVGFCIRLWFLATLLGGCGDAARLHSAFGEPTCRVDDDCRDAGLVCDFERCVAPSSRGRPLSLSLHVVPPGTRTDLVSQQVSQVAVTLGTSLLTYSLSNPSELRGRVFDDRNFGPVVSSVRLEREFGIPGLNLPYYTETDAFGVFRVLVPPGPYQVTVSPTRTDLPPRLFFGIDARGASPDAIFPLPSPERYLRVTGRIVRVDTVTNRPAVVAGARVVASSPDRTLRSTTSMTDADGRFTMFLPRAGDTDEATYRMTVEPDRAGGQLFPTVFFSERTFSSEPTDPRNDLVLSLGRWSEPRPVPIRVFAGDPLPPESVVVVLRSRETLRSTIGADSADIDGVQLHQTARVEPNGELTALMVPGEYDLVATALGASDAGMATRRVRMQEDGSVEVLDGTEDWRPVAALDIRLEPRRRVRARVTLPLGRGPAPGVHVIAQLEQVGDIRIAGFELPAQIVSVSGTTDADGTVTLPLQAGRYVVGLDPDPATFAPRWRQTRTVGSTEDQVELSLPEAGAVEGRILDPSGRSLAGATVEAWQTLGNTSWLAGSATTNADGVYRMVLPSVPLPVE